MRKYALSFAVICLLLSIAVIICSQFSLLKSLATDKMAQFVLVNSILLIGVSAFFAVFHDRMKLYLKNYRREKKI